MNTSTLELHEQFGTPIPPHAILSHRWEDQEVTFQVNGFEYVEREFRSVNCYDVCLSDPLQCIDSCCTDMSSSAELFEAIISMYRWYEACQVCYATLSDVSPGERDP